MRSVDCIEDDTRYLKVAVDWIIDYWRQDKGRLETETVELKDF